MLIFALLLAMQPAELPEIDTSSTASIAETCIGECASWRDESHAWERLAVTRGNELAQVRADQTDTLPEVSLFPADWVAYLAIGAVVLGGVGGFLLRDRLDPE